jgi:hypothetical protein
MRHTYLTTIHLSLLLMVAAVIVVFASPAGAVRLPGTQQRPQTFSSPDEAIQALVDATEKNDTAALLKIFGHDGRDVVQSGDPAQDREARAEFARAAHEKVFVDATKPDVATFVIGDVNWPFPIPLVRRDGKWQFDVVQGRSEILAHRIGANELNVIEVCRGFVEAELEYASLDRDYTGLLAYAQKVRSSPGKQDGLYWDEASDTLVPKGLADATVTGPNSKGLVPYHGYFFRVLDSQGPDAQGGAFQYVVDGKMIGGFALIAWPAEYAVSGLKTFVVNHNGVVFEKDLGANTAALAIRLLEFNPDSSWQRVAD